MLLTFILGETQKLVAQVKQTEVGTLALNLIGVCKDHGASGEEASSSTFSASYPGLLACSGMLAVTSSRCALIPPPRTSE